MAQFESSMYLKDLYGEPADIAGSFERGMKLGEMIKQKRADSLVKEAYQAGVVKNPDGSTTFDKSITIGKLMEADPRKAQEAELAFQQQDLAKQRFNASLGFQEGMRALQNPSYYQTAVQNLVKNGVIKPEEAPPAFDESFVKAYAVRAGSEKDYLDNMMREKESQARLAETRQANDFRRQEIGLRRMERQDLLEQKRDEKQIALTTPYGLANTVEDAKQLKAADEEKKNFDAKINELISLRENFGGEVLNREAVGRAKQLSKDLLLTYKNMAKLGVLSQADEDIINAIIPPDPLALRNPVEAAQGQDVILNNLKKFREDSDNDFAVKVQNRVRGGGNYVPQGQQSTQPKTPKAGQEEDGFIFMGGDPSNPQNWKKK